MQTMQPNHNRILAVVEDLFFAAKIAEAAKRARTIAQKTIREVRTLVGLGGSLMCL